MGPRNVKYVGRISVQRYQTLQLRLLSFQLRIKGDPLSQAWTRVQRYSTWMRAVTVEWWLGLDRDTIERMRRNTPAGGWFPALQNICW